MAYKSIMDHFDKIRARVIASNLADNIDLHPRAREDDKWRGGIFGTITFRNGGELQLKEEARMDRMTKDIDVQKYAYEYTGEGGFYFRYEMDTEASRNKDGTNRTNHPEFHLHVNSEEPRYMTHKTSFIEVFDFVVACFYS